MTSRWRIENTAEFDREFKKLDQPVQRRVMACLEDVENLENPRQRGKGLTANHVGVWRCRGGDYRIMAQITDDSLVILALRIAHRRGVY